MQSLWQSSTVSLFVPVCNLPNDIEEREANTVLDEDCEVFHIQHWFAEDRTRVEDKN